MPAGFRRYGCRHFERKLQLLVRIGVPFAPKVDNFLAIPFLLWFVGGHYWAGFTTLWQEYQGKLQWERQRELSDVERAEA